MQSWPTGHSAGAVPAAAVAVQAQRASIAQDLPSVCAAQGSAVAQTAAGQSASGGHATAVQAHAAPAPAHVSAVMKLAQGSATIAAASCPCGWAGGVSGVSGDDPQADRHDAANKSNARFIDGPP